MKLKGLDFADVVEIKEAVTDELKKVQKEEFSAASQKLSGRAKACIYASGTYFEQKGMCLPRVSSVFKKFSPKTFGPHCVLITPCINCRGTLQIF
jgi:coproporphyrinogen III oxidase